MRGDHLLKALDYSAFPSDGAFVTNRDEVSKIIDSGTKSH